MASHLVREFATVSSWRWMLRRSICFCFPTFLSDDALPYPHCIHCVPMAEKLSHPFHSGSYRRVHARTPDLAWRHFSQEPSLPISLGVRNRWWTQPGFLLELKGHIGSSSSSISQWPLSPDVTVGKPRHNLPYLVGFQQILGWSLCPQSSPLLTPRFQYSPVLPSVSIQVYLAVIIVLLQRFLYGGCLMIASTGMQETSIYALNVESMILLYSVFCPVLQHVWGMSNRARFDIDARNVHHKKGSQAV